MYKVQQCCKWDYYLSIIQEAEVAGCLCCFLHSFPQLCGSSAPICPVSAGHSIKSSCPFSQITDQLQLSISVRPAHKHTEIFTLKLYSKILLEVVLFYHHTNFLMILKSFI